MIRFAGLAVLLSLVALPASASRWMFDKGLDIQSVTTGNVDLAGTDQQSDTVIRARPYLGIRRISGRTKARLFYAPDVRWYLQGTRDSKIGHTLRADSSTELVKRAFFLRLSARASQVLTDPASRAGFDNINNPDAYTQSFVFSVIPDFRLPLVNHKYASARFSPGVNYGFTADAAGGQSGLSQTGSTTRLDIVSGPYFNRMPWYLRYRNDVFDVNREDNWGRLDAGVRYRISANYSLNLSLGYDSLRTEGQDNQGGVRWHTTATWSPTARTSLSVGVGEAFFGTDWSLAFRHRYKHTSFTANYYTNVQDVTTELLQRDVVPFEDEFGQVIVDPLEGNPLLVEVNTPYLIDDIYIRHALDGTVAYVRGRTSLRARLWYDARDYQRSPLDTKDARAELVARRRLSRKLSGNLRLDYWSHSEDNPDAQNFDQYGAQLSFGYSLSQKIGLSVGYRWLDRSSSIPDQNYDDGQITFGLSVNYL